MAPAAKEKINLEKSDKDNLYVPCFHMYMKDTIFDKHKKEKHLHEVVLTRNGCQHDCFAQGKKGRFSCPFTSKSKELKEYFEYWEKNQPKQATKEEKK